MPWLQLALLESPEEEESMSKPSASDVQLYLDSPEIHAVVHKLADLVMRNLSHDDLFDELIRFFGQYDRMRTEQVESLKARVAQLLQESSPAVVLPRP